MLLPALQLNDASTNSTFLPAAVATRLTVSSWSQSVTELKWLPVDVGVPARLPPVLLKECQLLFNWFSTERGDQDECLSR